MSDTAMASYYQWGSQFDDEAPAKKKSAFAKLKAKQLAALEAMAATPSNSYTTGTGQKLTKVHEHRPECDARGCTIHHPTDPHPHWPTKYVGGLLRRMERVCPCGVGHPDTDWLSYVRDTRNEPVTAGVLLAQHLEQDCCGCCMKLPFPDDNIEVAV